MKTISILLILIFVNSSGFSQDSNQSEEDSSHVIISAIKTVSGEAPDNEFFMANLKVNFDNFFSIANVDIALSNAESDSPSSDQKRLTDAGLYVNYDLSKALGSNFSLDLERSLFTGIGAKIFNTEAYYGLMLGSIELSNSKLYGTYFIAGYFRRIFNVPDDRPLYNELDQRLANDNFFTEFLIHSESLTFFEYLSFRAGVLVPLIGTNGSFDDVQFRITVAVPVGDLVNF